MPEHIQALMAIQGTLTAASGGFNAVYFVGYSASHPARKIAARVLLLVNLSFLLQGLYWAVPFGNGSFNPTGSGPLAAIGLITLASSLAITALILRQRSGDRRGG